MITARLHGRLGNQMFQYAAARALAERLGVAVALDSREAVRRGEGVLTRVFDLDLTDPAPLPPQKKEAPLRYALWRAFGSASGLTLSTSVADDRSSLIETCGRVVFRNTVV